ncbi:MBL fold metallo-hydrolase [Candidatus Methanodesulfokora washburnensis]|jgi:ribonuclease Z|uniref:MBL fold metallo-hydrolase n=1 Tax=Candidatus Methanodesulfokora washburnensis TaxID=2478471 RepID=A0A3R9RR99_9CREN|nr:MBL fold metallo-hydrolase [Candidatus Methanodesulfokores washburnensis]RSN76681.1 MBL fold metallo-hydrolase [Candidatus Methanodesulfokores washburnensis]
MNGKEKMNQEDKIIILGNCSGQTAEYETTNFILFLKGKKIFLDMGPGAIKQMYRAGLFVTDIDFVVLTHSHTDHTLGFPYFAFSNFVERAIEGRKGPDVIPIIALPEVYKGVMDMFRFCHPPGRYPMFNFENLEASNTEKKVFEFEGIKITTTPVTHSVPTIGVSFELSSTKITFSSDTIYDERLVELAKESNILVHEALGTKEIKKFAELTKHGIAEEAGRAANDAKVQMLALVHPMPQYRKDPTKLIEEAKKYYDGKIIVPSELEVLPLNKLHQR